MSGPFLPKQERTKAVRIALFNHKGGVGKTTLTVNIAVTLAKQNLRVLLVDADPQCNLTSFLIEDSVVDELLSTSDAPAGQTLWSAVKPLYDGSGSMHAVKPLELHYNGLELLPGDIQLAKFEAELESMWVECFQRKPRGLNGMNSISSLVNTLTRRHNADYVFFDCGPNIGALNRAILLDCDFFIVPVACDLFSIRALKTLGFSLQSWIKDWSMIGQLAPSGVFSMPGLPKLLGYVPQQFRVYRDSISLAYATYLPRIERGMQEDVHAVLKAMNPELVPWSASALKLGDIKNFGGLATAAQDQGVAIYDVQAGTPEQRTNARKAFVALSKRIRERTSNP